MYKSNVWQMNWNRSCNTTICNICIHACTHWDRQFSGYYPMLKYFVWSSLLFVLSLIHVWLFATPYTGACQAPLSMGFSRQECWNGLPFPPPGDLPNPKMKPASPALAGRFFTLGHLKIYFSPSCKNHSKRTYSKILKIKKVNILTMNFSFFPSLFLLHIVLFLKMSLIFLCMWHL